MTTTVRRLTEDDTDVMQRQFREAFGAWDEPDPPVAVHAPGKTWWGVEVDGVLAATALDREYHSWFAGALVPTAGIGGVTVAPEHRGSGLLTPLLEHLLAGARERGALISTLFATTPGIYRRFGYEVVSALDSVSVPTRSLVLGGDHTVRRATEADAGSIRAVHERWAARRSGPLSHTGPLFSEPPTLRVSGVSVSEHPDGSLSGYASWDRGRGYGSEGRLTVHQLVADDTDALRSLLSVLGSFASVTPTTVLTTSGWESWRHLVRTDHATVVSSAPYSLAVLDPVALERSTHPASIGASLPFRLGDASLRLDVADGVGTLHAHDWPATRELTAGGLALTFAGAETSATLRELGHLHGEDADDALWDLISCRGPVHVRDYF